MDEKDEKNKKREDIRRAAEIAKDLIPSWDDNEVPLSRIENTQWDQLVYNPISMLQLSMPHKDQHNALEWQVRNGESDLLLRAGKIKNKRGLFDSALLPYSWFPRFLLLWIVYTVQKSGSNKLFLGHTKAHILSGLELNRHQDRYKDLRELIPALLHSELVINHEYPEIDIGDEELFPYQGEGDHTEYQRLASNIAHFTNKKKDRDSSNVKRGYYIYLSDKFYKTIRANPLPIDFEHVKELRKNGNSYKLDIYTFLAERLYQIPAGEPLLIKRDDIEDLFGAGTKLDEQERKRFFRDTFKPALKAVMEVYTEAKVDFELKEGVMLHHSPPPLLLEAADPSPPQLPE